MPKSTLYYMVTQIVRGRANTWTRRDGLIHIFEHRGFPSDIGDEMGGSVRFVRVMFKAETWDFHCPRVASKRAHITKKGTGAIRILGNGHICTQLDKLGQGAGREKPLVSTTTGSGYA